ncbi:gamma-glutamyltransferase [Neolewinella lacunae]|uniref:Glutathione hydrolase proenzyme n=1 Tax=Neolewinella lacunae TaxID=1517758 RepID=A0A923PHI6_9BACT|nr:gamma-glutamyltransferase [Neolewinella lacunae]MBC6992826.1 gamma-glutamyltransferase [Neolewinella lacunae]MDN3636085.1 gamma-glutamyltransferase [Neolewinella lacunae]
MKTFAQLLLLALLCAACETAPKLDYVAEKSGDFPTAAIVGPHPLATEVGLKVLRSGGNAIDAAVAVQLAMAVVYPRAGNLGGGGFLVYRAAGGSIAALDYREKAPAAASRNMYLDSLGNVVANLSTRGHLAVGVPGTVAGIETMHRKYGTKPWDELVAYAIDLAANGYRLSQAEVNRIKAYHADFAEFNAQTPFSDTTVVEGSLVQQKDLAATLERIRDHGAAGFYTGQTAQLIVAEMQSGGGLITDDDLRDYTPVWREPITKNYKDYRIISMPPSSSGGICLAQMVEMLEPYPLADYGFQSTRSVHLTVEAMRRAYADRAEYLGDSDFYPIPVDSLLNDAYLRGRMADFRPDTAGVSVAPVIISGSMDETFETTHISIVDAAGNAVSITTTLNGNFGSKVMVDGAGFFLNNEMDDFSAKPGVPNMFGLVGKEANAIQPGKRMLSSMTPTIIEKDGALFMVLGAPGGSTIITAVLQTFLNVVEYGMDLPAAVAAPRFHHQWLPDQVIYEQGALAGGVRDSLAAMGHQLREVNAMAVIKAIQRRPDGTLVAAGDHRNPDDDVAGY